MLESTWKREAKMDRMRSDERFGQLIGLLVSVIVIAFFLLHWTKDTGFYWDGFSEVDATVLFGPMLFGMVPPLFRFMVGMKNPSRPSDVMVSLLFAFSAAYFLWNFKFDMSVFSQPLPGSLRFLLDWINEDIARFFLAVGIAGGIISAAWNALAYVKVKEILAKKDQ